jgi:hypothetical protein
MIVTEPSTFHCGPLDVDVIGGPAALAAKVAECLLLFDHVWPSPQRRIRFEVTRAAPVAMGEGTYLSCARMTARLRPDGSLEATTRSGAWCEGHIDLEPDLDVWTITVPDAAIEAGALEDVEDLVGLALTTGWRRAGWVPLHAAGVVHDAGVCALLCAPSGGGKSTLSAGLVRRGWRVLGDDKLLVRTEPGARPRVAALLHTFNLHPSTREWFPEVGDLEQLPRYSAWTPKRKLSVTSVWDSAPAFEAEPTHVVTLERAGRAGTVATAPLSATDVLSTLLHQTVIPAERGTAAHITRTIAACARDVRGLAIRIGDDAYRDSAALDAVEQALLA